MMTADRFSKSHVMIRIIVTLATALSVLIALVGVARADAIDGEWCASDGAHMSIAGADITTPGGTRMKGNYSRHAFDYVVPAGEAGAGETVNILLRSEYFAVSRQGASTAPPKEWRRCAVRTS